jgi:hypothetical protein
MTTLAASEGMRSGLAPGEFDVEFVADDGARHTVSLADAARVRLADMAPARRIRARKGQRHLPGRWWSVTDGRHVGYESWLERDLIRTLRRVIVIT